MIKINYLYQVKEGSWKQGNNTFYDVIKALRFIHSINSKKTSFVTGWITDDPEENEYLSLRVTLKPKSII